jgi:hypothetical protein
MIANFFRLVHSDVPYELFYKTPDKYYNMRPKYYDRVYLCIEDLRPTGAPNVTLPIKGFLCRKFDDFEFADEYLQAFPNKDNIRSVMIPVCKWCPVFLDTFVLNSYLQKFFWIGKHSFVRNDGQERYK